MRRMTIAPLLTVFFLTALSVSQEPNKPPRTGADFLQWCRGSISVLEASEAGRSALMEKVKDDPVAISMAMWCGGYMRGVYDSMELLRTVMNEGATDAPKGPLGLCLPSVAPAQLLRITIKWLDEHPENHHWLMEVIVYKALVDVFPCRPSQPQDSK